MRQILHSYKLRLTNLSQANRSLRLGRLSKRRDIDLKDFSFIEEDTAEQILQKIIQGKDVSLISRLNPRFEATNLLDRRLNQVYRTAQGLEEESGSYDLFLGYPFVEGKFIDETICRCPVLLFPVRLERKLKGRPRWKLKYLKEEGIQFNKTFFLAYERYNQLRLKDEFWEEEVETGKDWLEWLRGLYEKVKEYEVEVNFNPRLFDLELKVFEDKKKEELQQLRRGVLTFQSQAVLGIFPQSDSALLTNYNKIEEGLENFPVHQLFQPPLPSRSKDLPYIKEEDRFFVTDVDQSQEDAILKVKHGNSLVIHGPPGTGKSQVIVNIIADALAHGKKILLVSQKRAALDVVYKRLEALGLSDFSVLVHDYRHDRGQVFRQLQRQIDAIEGYQRDLIDLNITKWEHDYKRLSRELDRLNRNFEELYQALIGLEEFGMSAHELYLSSDPEEEKLPLKALAQDLNREQLHDFLYKIRSLKDYSDLMRPDHPWNPRLSFHSYTSTERNNILSAIEAMPEYISGIHLQYVKLEKKLSSRMLNPALNRERIAEFKEIDGWVEKTKVLTDWNALQSGKTKAAAVGKRLEKLEKLLQGLDARKWLDDGYWKLLGSLLKHSQKYRDTYTKPLRFLRLDYQQARWFLKKIAEGFGQTFTPEYYRNVLEREIDYFRELHDWYVKYHEEEFFGDFPLLDVQEEKWKWLEEKRKHLGYFEQLKSMSYFPKIKPKFRLGQFDLEKWRESMELVQSFEAFNQNLIQVLNSWQWFLHESQILLLSQGFKDPGEIQPFVEALKESLKEEFEDLRDLDVLLKGATTKELEGIRLLQPHFSLDEELLINKIKQSIYFFWIEQLESQKPILREVSSRSWPRKEREFTEKYDQKRNRVNELILRRLKESLVEIIEYNRLNNPITFREIYHQVSKKRRLWSVRKLIEKTWNKGLNLLAPCWMASPESAAAIFPMQKDFFDLVIFDEASQCFVERAIPVLLRGKQGVIAGDNKQLAPTNLYTVRYEEAGEEEFVEDEMALEVSSILDLAINTFEESHLNWHYRSKDQQLINFSNQAFYEGKLEVISPAQPDPLDQPPLNWIAVEGEWKQNSNLPEGLEVIRLIKQLIRRGDQPSIGIVTFNYQQQELIRDLIDQELESLGQVDPSTYELLQACLQKRQGEEFQGLFVKNIENVQGDERDIIIFSTGYGYDEKGRLSSNFGLLNKEAGENRLNVAISRARRKIYVVCSFNPGDLRVEQSVNQGPRLFRDYLRFVKAVSEGRSRDALRILNVQQEEDLRHEAPNILADRVEAYYRKKGFDLVRNYGDTGYKIDLAVRKAGEHHPSLAVECEGPNYFSGKSAKEREIYRKKLLEAKGWEVKRIWSRNHWLEREAL